MMIVFSRRLAASLLIALGLAAGMGSALAQSSGSVAMPNGVDFGRVRLLDQGRMTKVYVDMLRIDDSKESRMFPAEMSKLVDITPAGLTRLFTDTILRSRRFEVYDLRSTVTAEHADIVVDAQIISATQEFRPLEGGLQAAYTSVLLSVQMKDMYTGKYLFGTAVQVEGRNGLVNGERAVLQPGENPEAPLVRQRLAADYQRALRRAFIGAGQRIEAILRPQARLISVEGPDVGIFGGQQLGLQADDELVVYRPKIVKLGDREIFGSTKAVALIRCSSVGTETSQCTVQTLAPDYKPQEGDYAILTDASLRKTRWE
ncbi:MAG TPA: hypothetical protein VGM81_05300 [Burkholderiaceae bacterium]|jgi:hypothetical protein